MTSTLEPPTTRVHPVARFVARAHEVLDGVRQAPAWSMSPAEQRATLVELSALQARLDALRGELLLAGDRNAIGELDASPSTTVWYAHATRCTRGAARRELDRARALDTEFAATRQAFSGGEVAADQVEVIVAGLHDLRKAVSTFLTDRAAHPAPGQDPAQPPPLPAGLLELAEDYLLQCARTEDARALKRSARDLLAVVAPEVAEEALGRRVAAEERAARARMRLLLRDNGDGTHSGSFTIPDLHAAMLTKALDALCSPRGRQPGDPGHHLDAEGQRLPRPEQRGQAFCGLLERFPADRLPTLGGLNATVVVTVPLDALRAWYATAGLDTGQVISASEARRLCCAAGIIPAVLGGRSEVLDLGREQRLFSPAQRRAKNLLSPTCETDGCPRPAVQCDAHHEIPWVQGGRTDLRHAVNLCPWHHHRAHDPRYRLDRHPGGSVTFHRRT